MRAVITGGSGFVGQWLARRLLERGDDVWLSGFGSAERTPAILSEAERTAAHWCQCDITRTEDIRRLLDAAKPELTVHLAGISFVPAADAAPERAWDVNVVGSVRLLAESARDRAAGVSDPIVVVIGSGTQYGHYPPAAMPLKESVEQRPTSVYAATKAAQEIAALQVWRTTGLRVICTRSFSHSGIGHAPEFLLPSLAARAVQLRAAPAPLRIGNDVVRDYLHIDDVVDAYISLAEKGTAGEVYNVCSGVGVSVRDLALAALKSAGVDGEVVSDEQLQRPMDMPVLIGSNDKLRATGWRPRKTYRDIFDDLLATS